MTLTVRISLGQTEVTQEQRKVKMDTKPWKDQLLSMVDSDHQATYLSHDVARAFCECRQNGSGGRKPIGERTESVSEPGHSAIVLDR